MKQSALFFDIDGTLLSEVTHKIPESALEALAQAKRNGHLLFINTGRTYCCVPSEIKGLTAGVQDVTDSAEGDGLNLPEYFDGLLCGCGSYLTFRGEILLESHLDVSKGRKIIEKMKECRVDGTLEGTEDLYCSREPSRFEKLERVKKYFDYLGIAKTKYMEDPDISYDKLYVYIDEKSDAEEFFGFMREQDMEIIKRGVNEYEIAQAAYSKGTACEFIRRHFGLDMDRIYVFGDSNNDLAMFEYAKHTVAMGKHSVELEPDTEYVTAAVEEDGIAKALRHYGLI